MKYNVAIPITGIIYVEVEAADEEQAITTALHMEHSVDDIEEWSVHERVVQGNVFHGLLASANAEPA